MGKEVGVNKMEKKGGGSHRGKEGSEEAKWGRKDWRKQKRGEEE